MTNNEFRRIVDAALERQRQLNDVVNSSGVKAFVQQAAERQRQVNQALSSPGVKAFVQQAAERQRQVNQALSSPGVKAFVQQAAERQRQLKDSLSRFGELAARAQAFYREWDEAERRILEVLAPRGWLISPDTSLAEIHGLLQIAESEGIDALEAELIKALSPTRCREIVEGLYAHQSFANWRPVLDQALDAHDEGKFALCVPIWLIAVEGIFSSELGLDHLFARIRKRKGKPVRRALSAASRSRLADPLRTVIAAVASQVPRGSTPTPGELRRHAILHGLDPGYGTEKASVQGILLLEALHFHLDVMLPDLPTPDVTAP